jgi:phosphodiesterase/alkaline phosphatase D-like protein
LLQLGAAGLLLRGCGDNLAPRAAAAAVLEPAADAMTVAVWAQRARSATVELRDPSGALVTSQIALLGDSGSALVDLHDLAPATRYAIIVTTSDGYRLGPHVATTAPADTDPRTVRIAVVADADTVPENASDLCDQVIAAAPDLIVAIGDFPYTDNGPPAMTVSEYRARHVETRMHPPVRALHEACGMWAIYDDHEVRNDWDGRTRLDEPARYAAALQVWDEFFPQRAAAGEIRYRRWRWGAHLECFLLDCRRFRSANTAVDDARKTMLGAEQHRWLIDGATSSTATFKLILTSIPLDYGAGDDHWASFTTERDAMLADLVGTPGVLFASADQHWFAAHRHAFGVREMQIGPLARGLGTPPPAVPGVLFRAVRYNAGLIDIAGDQLTLTGLGADGERFYQETLSAADLTPRA